MAAAGVSQLGGRHAGEGGVEGDGARQPVAGVVRGAEEVDVAGGHGFQPQAVSGAEEGQGVAARGQGEVEVHGPAGLGHALEEGEVEGEDDQSVPVLAKGPGQREIFLEVPVGEEFAEAGIAGGGPGEEDRGLAIGPDVGAEDGLKPVLHRRLPEPDRAVKPV
jgi:hypothetical protein